MPTLDIDENIKRLEQTIEQMTQEVFRLQGVLNTFMNFKKGGPVVLLWQDIVISFD